MSVFTFIFQECCKEKYSYEGLPSIKEGEEDYEGEGEAGFERKKLEIDELDPPKVLGDLLESLAGAIFIDSGLSLSCVWRVFQPHFQEKIGQ